MLPPSVPRASFSVDELVSVVCRINIPLIFLTCTQLTDEEKIWLVRSCLLQIEKRASANDAPSVMSSCGATSDFSCLGSVQAGVRIRETRGIDLLEGNKPNRGWLGPEMSGEEVSATTAEERTAEESTAVAGR